MRLALTRLGMLWASKVTLLLADQTTMTAQILILEPDKKQADKLVTSLKQADDYAPAVVTSVKEACMLLIQKPHHLALIPVADGDKIVRAMRALQPDLRIVVMTPGAETLVPRSFSGLVQGVLIRSLAKVDLVPVLRQAFNEPMVAESEPPRGVGTGQTGPLFGAALVDLELDDVVKTAVVSRESALMTFAGELNEMQAAAVAQRAGQGWQTGRPETARLQFVQLPAWSRELLLYTCPVAERYLLTLVAEPDASLSQLRQSSQRLAAVLGEMMMAGATTSAKSQGDVRAYGRVSYAIVWRPVAPLPDGLRVPLRRAMLRLAAENDCNMLSADVAADLVHLVVACPPGRDSVWAAYLFKNGSEESIQQQYNVSARLWQTGFYAVESSTPLTEVELNIFLERS